MTKFDLRQLTLASGTFTFLSFLVFWASIEIFPMMEIHRTAFLEMLPATTLPLSLGMWLTAAIGSILSGALAGYIFGAIFNAFASK